MLKVLFTATISKHILRFHLPYLQWFKQQGFETHVAANGDEEIPFCDVKFELPFERSPYSLKNISAYKDLKRIIGENDYSIIHCHTPVGSVVSRMAARTARKRGTKVLYTAHGFHFYENAPPKSWFLYYPIEKYLARYTDGIITINSEDEELLKRKKFKTGAVYKIDGVGVESGRFSPISGEDKAGLRRKKGYRPDDFILIYAAEFISRKNHKFILDTVDRIRQAIPTLKILFAGRGVLMEDLIKYSDQIGVKPFVEFLGFRQDINELIAMSDIGISSSRAEGLGLNLAEEMFCGIPVVASSDRGHKEIIEHGINGFLFEQDNHEQFAGQIIDLYNDEELRIKISRNALETVQRFSLDNSLKSMAEIYRNYF